ncbi:hypothetical protein BS47DRAFT_1386415 [Hydnum rufescens UP504]|uniref:Uncharacterized protein n=1 Tax=Hydnum rufescens UP504 TaxID=1448309 RepID=A0A9P6ADB6_9AGAM|nr:hypothetical protein BS47DRAFT_1386415 [Hydnum rufescens UP504]
MELPSHTLAGHKSWMLCVEWEAREWKLVTSGHDGQVCIWDPKSGKPLGDALKGHMKWITLLAWGLIHIILEWHHCQRITLCAFGQQSHNYQGSCLGGDHSIQVWDADNGKVVYILKDHAHWVTTLALNTDFVLCTSPYDHMGKHYGFNSYSSPAQMITHFSSGLFLGLRQRWVCQNHPQDSWGIRDSPYGQWAASVGFDNCLRVWGGQMGNVSKDHTVKVTHFSATTSHEDPASGFSFNIAPEIQLTKYLKMSNSTANLDNCSVCHQEGVEANSRTSRNFSASHTGYKACNIWETVGIYMESCFNYIPMDSIEK